MTELTAKIEDENLTALNKIQVDAPRLVVESLQKKIEFEFPYLTAGDVTWISVPCPFSRSIVNACMHKVQYQGQKDVNVQYVDCIVKEDRGQFRFGIRLTTRAEHLFRELTTFCNANVPGYNKFCKHLPDTILLDHFSQVVDPEKRKELYTCLANYHIALRFHDSAMEKHIRQGNPSYFPFLPELEQCVLDAISTENSSDAARIIEQDKENWKAQGEKLKDGYQASIDHEGITYVYTREELDTFDVHAGVKSCEHSTVFYVEKASGGREGPAGKDESSVE